MQEGHRSHPSAVYAVNCAHKGIAMLRRLLLKHLSLSLFGCLFLLLSTPRYAAAGIGFQPVLAEELSMTSEPAAPGAPAIILYRQVDRNDASMTTHQDNYFRIKILTDAGRSYADVEIPFLKDRQDVSNLHARSIAPDGSITNYEGKPFEKTIVKARGLKYLARVFTLPNVQKGSIIEYYYTYDFSDKYLFDSRWILSEELFTKLAKFSLKSYQPQYGTVGLRWSWSNLPPGTAAPAEGPDKIIRLTVANIPAFKTEDYMPPEDELKARVNFVYSFDLSERDKDKFWVQVGKRRYEELNSFLGKHNGLRAAVEQTVSPGDDPETKARKLYARVQQLRNTSYEYKKTAQEEKRDTSKNNKNVEDVWKHGYGDGFELAWLYLGLLRDAGIEAYGAWISDRDNYFFDPSQMDSLKLDVNVVLLKLNGKDVFCDPGIAFAPYGLLEWPETGVLGLRLDKDGGTWIRTPLPDSSASQIIRKAELKASMDGDVEGKLTVTYTGLEALTRRIDQRYDDDQERKKYLEDTVKSYISAGADVDLTNQPDWKSSSPQLVAEFKVKIPGWISSAGKRGLLPVGMFSASEKGLFDHADREHPIYFEFPFQKSDDITIELPEGMVIGNLPAPVKTPVGSVSYSLTAEKDKNTLHLARTLRVDMLLLAVNQYPNLRRFFQFVRTGDDAQVMVQPQLAEASK
jgi:hypothetical protein